jgi:hypothetical protein
MKVIAKLAIVAASVLISTGIVQAAPAKNTPPVLWNGVRAGMSLTEVQKVIPGATLEGETIVGGPTKVAGVPFDSFVELSNGHATSVKLIGNGVDATTVATALTTKYGQPTSQYRCQRLSCSGTWSAPGNVKITLLRWNAALILSYQTVDLSNI